MYLPPRWPVMILSATLAVFMAALAPLRRRFGTQRPDA